MDQLEITVEKLEETARLPEYGTAGAACFDIFASRVVDVGERTLTVGTGLRFDIPDGWVMRIYSRSGQGFRHGIRLCNSTAIIDSDYTGEVMIKLHCDERLWAQKIAEIVGSIQDGGKVAVAQAEICPVEYVSFRFGEVDKLTARGANGFGSTDNKAAS